MEIFGHALSGIALGQVIDPKPSHPRWLWPTLSAIAALFPDIDGITVLGGPDLYKRWHQLYTHNVIAFAILPLVVAAIAWRLTRLPFRKLWLLMQTGMALHLLGDVIAQWPLPFLRPLSDAGFSFGLIEHDFSLGLVLVLLVGVLAGTWDPLIPYRRWTSLATLLAAVAYVLFGPGW